VRVDRVRRTVTTNEVRFVTYRRCPHPPTRAPQDLGITRVLQKDQIKGNFRLVESFDECEAQVRQASAFIEKRTRRRPRYFAFPYGEASPYLRETYLPEHGAKYGLRAAFSIDRAFVTAESDRWFLPRFTHGAADVATPADFEAILRGRAR